MKKSITPKAPRVSRAGELQQLVDCGKQFYERRWMWGTAGNLSVKLANDPLEFAITPSGVNKGRLRTQDLLVQKEGGKTSVHALGFRPSAETVIHEAIHKALPGCGAVFHVHPVYSTLMSAAHGDPRQMRTLHVDWIEMMKGVGVAEDESAEITILPNYQDVSLIARDVTHYIQTAKKLLPVVLIYNHGLTGWGTTPEQAQNHLEIMEWVCEYLYLKAFLKH